ncbi:class I SAM-dependent methyltransferase [Streptomyces gibsoniae]|uniref:Methyltransferase domain-containing protein n=1 Tax=Streptomyces gibsoniae TaxID=3075529 RepID=A0ABU2TTN8_9ACTN|nr:methyltransferase domain-containing protein [Streptomyces sp. DSM 41699]MDT0464324.1 methyltransferase domain-containing protein [Streptomyces sp. DSM 41699]
MTHTVPTRPGLRWALAAGTVGAVAAGAWWFGDKAPYPYAQRRLLDLQLPGLTPAGLNAVLRPGPGERILEIGPGTGLQSLHIAPQLGPDGRLDVLDIQPEMLDHVMRRAERKGLTNITPTLSDARELPFPDGAFDAMYLVTALGEIPEPERVLTEAVRVLAPDGRLVVGEFFDRHWIPFGTLHRLADASGLHLAARRGSTLAYLARFRPCSAVARTGPLRFTPGCRA